MRTIPYPVVHVTTHLLEICEQLMREPCTMAQQVARLPKRMRRSENRRKGASRLSSQVIIDIDLITEEVVGQHLRDIRTAR